MSGRVEIDTLPALTAGVGTVRDYVQAGASIRIGQGLDSDFGAPRIRPGLSGSDAYTPTRPFVWYVFAGADGQADCPRRVPRRQHVPQQQPACARRSRSSASSRPGWRVMLYGVRLSYTQTLADAVVQRPEGRPVQFRFVRGIRPLLTALGAAGPGT